MHRDPPLGEHADRGPLGARRGAGEGAALERRCGRLRDQAVQSPRARRTGPSPAQTRSRGRFPGRAVARGWRPGERARAPLGGAGGTPDPSHPARVGHPPHARGARGPHAHPPAALRCRVATPVRQPAAVPPGVHHQPAAEDRGRSDAPAADRHRAGRRLSDRSAPLSVACACAGFLAIDYFFQLPYDRFSVAKPLDWSALLVFLATSAVTSELVTRAIAQAEAARRRADEVARLSHLGSQALNAGRAQDALATLAEVIRATVGGVECEIYATDDGAGAEAPAAHARVAGERSAASDDHALVVWVAHHARAAV